MKAFRMFVGSTVVMAVFAASGLEVWHFPYNSPYVVTNPRDGLPDFNLSVGWGPENEFTSATIACPSQLQKPCCAKCHKHEDVEFLFEPPLLGGENCGACCNKTIHGRTRACAGGFYCQAAPGDIKSKLPAAFPAGFKGKSVSKADVPFIPRTRKNILERAIGWLAHNIPYGGCSAQSWSIETCGDDDDVASCPKWSHGGSCCSYVSMALGVSNVQGGRGHQYRKQIACAAMKPGDFVAQHHPNGGINHWWMFREWSVPSNPRAGHRGYQMGGGKGVANVFRTKPPFCGAKYTMHCVTCFTYAKLLNDSFTSAAVELWAPAGIETEWLEPDEEPRAVFATSAEETVVV